MAISMVEARKKAKIKQKEIAEMMGLSPVTVLRWEKGLTIPKQPQITMYAQLCGVEPKDIFLPTE